MGRIRVSRNERKPISFITSEYVESCMRRVTPRDIQIIYWLNTFNVLNSAQLTILMDEFYNIAKGIQRCNDRLRVLYDIHFINKYTPPLAPGLGLSKQYAWLDRGGARFLELEHFRRRETLPATYLHTSLVVDIYCTLYRADKNGELKLHYLKHEIKQEWPIIPDLVTVFQIGKKGYAYFIEVDRSEKKEKDEIEKIQSYRNWAVSNTWINEPWSKIMPRPIFPVVLYVFDESKPKWKRRATVFRNAASSCGLTLHAMGMSEFQYFLHEKREG